MRKVVFFFFFATLLIIRFKSIISYNLFKSLAIKLILVLLRKIVKRT